MNNNIKILLCLAIVIVLAVIGFRYLSKGDSVDNTINEPTPVETASIQGCYVATLGKDIYSLKIASQEGGMVEGTLVFKNFEKDSSAGTFKGTYKDGILLGEYSFNSEGMDSVMQVIFKKTADGFIRGFGEVDEEGTHFTDLDNITYDPSYVFRPAATCTTSLNAGK